MFKQIFLVVNFGTASECPHVATGLLDNAFVKQAKPNKIPFKDLCIFSAIHNLFCQIVPVMIN